MSLELATIFVKNLRVLEIVSNVYSFTATIVFIAFGVRIELRLVRVALTVIELIELERSFAALAVHNIGESPDFPEELLPRNPIELSHKRDELSALKVRILFMGKRNLALSIDS